MKILFFGSDGFAIPSLHKLHQSSHKIAAVVTQLDKPAGRGKKLTPCPAATAARELKIPVWQLTTLKDKGTIDRLLSLQPDLIVVVAYGNYIPDDLIQPVPHKAINIHPSLLPKYRGASPIQTAVLNGDSETGVSTMTVAPEMDAGDIYLQEKTPIGENETAMELATRLSTLGADLLLKTIEGLETKSITPKPQNANQVVPTRKFEKEDGKLDFSKPASEIHNRIRACQPWPGTFCSLKNKLFKIYTASVLPGENTETPGRLKVENQTLTVACGKNSLLLQEIQIEGRRKMTTEEFLKGFKIPEGTTLS